MATIPVISDEVLRAATRMPLKEYLRTMFHPDREYVDGVAEERNVGEWDHSRMQFGLAAFLMLRRADWGIEVTGECRLQVRPDRFRIPDVMILRAGETIHRYPTRAPLVCIEILSPEDTWKRLQAVVDDYVAMGVKHIWAIDPETRKVYDCDSDGLHRTDEFTVPGTAIRLTATEIFAVLG